jgi:hypothetical protein
LPGKAGWYDKLGTTQRDVLARVKRQIEGRPMVALLSMIVAFGPRDAAVLLNDGLRATLDLLTGENRAQLFS